jgi:hypothetical protein
VGCGSNPVVCEAAAGEIGQARHSSRVRRGVVCGGRQAGGSSSEQPAGW